MVAAGLALPSCSSDEVQAVSQEGAVKFGVGASNQARGGYSITTLNIKEFKTWAVASNKLGAWFMEGYVVSGSNTVVSGTSVTGSWDYVNGDQPTKFWPNEGTVDFFSVAPESAYKKVTVDNSGNGAFKFEDYTVVDDASEDLLYAYNKGVAKPKGNDNTPVNVNFHHAFANLQLQVRNVNPTLSLYIDDVKIVNLKNKATLSWATATTTPWYNTDNKRETELANSWGTWSTPEGNTLYTFDIEKTTDVICEGKENAEFVWLSQFNGEAKALNNYNEVNGLFVMPQTVTAWDVTKSNSSSMTAVTAKEGEGSYFALKVRIVDNTGATLWPKMVADNAEFGTGYVLIPVPSVTWKQGKRYVYKFTFGDGAGYTPGDDPELVLKKVTFAVTVDEFQTEEPIEVDMANKPKQTEAAGE